MSAQAGSVPRRGIRLDSRLRATAGSEWIKFRSLRSGPFALSATALIVVVGAWLLGDNNRGSYLAASPAGKAAFDPVFTVFQVIELAQLFVGALGVITVTGEYASGLIRTTLAATPQRGLVLAAKAVLAGLVSFALAVVIVFTAFFAGQGILSAVHAPHVSLGDHNVLAHLLGTVCYMTAAGLIGLFTGVLVRSAAAITSMFGLLLVLPVLADRITPDAVSRHTVPYLPSNLGDEILHHHAGLSPGPAVAGLAAWVLVLAAAAAFSLRGRDA